MKTKLFALGVLLGAFPQISSAIVSYTGGTYSDNLDGLGNSSAWSNDSTLPGWFAYETRGQSFSPLPGVADSEWGLVTDGTHNNYAPGTGQQSNVSLVNFGISNSSTNRSLGTYNWGSLRDVAFALVLRNDTGTACTSFSLSYFGEQWQITSSRLEPGMKLDFSYGVFSTFDTGSPPAYNPGTILPFSGIDPNILTRFYNGYTRPANGALDFSAFVFAPNTLDVLDGNAPENRQQISSTQQLNWLPGQYLVLRWFDDYTSGQVQAKLAVNDLQFTATPEPTSLALLAAAAAGLASRRRRQAYAGR